MKRKHRLWAATLPLLAACATTPPRPPEPATLRAPAATADPFSCAIRYAAENRFATLQSDRTGGFLKIERIGDAGLGAQIAGVVFYDVLTVNVLPSETPGPPELLIALRSELADDGERFEAPIKPHTGAAARALLAACGMTQPQ